MGEYFDPNDNQWLTTPHLLGLRNAGTVVLMKDGSNRLLITGGLCPCGQLVGDYPRLRCWRGAPETISLPGLCDAFLSARLFAQ